MNDAFFRLCPAWLGNTTTKAFRVLVRGHLHAQLWQPHVHRQGRLVKLDAALVRIHADMNAAHQLGGQDDVGPMDHGRTV